MLPAMLDTEMPLDEATADWVGDALGPFEIVGRFAHSHGYSRLWRVAAGSGTFWVKLHRFPGKWSGEVHALREWAPSLGLSPRVVAVRNEPPGVILTELPGTTATEVALTVDQEKALWFEAGAYAARLHERRNPWFGAIEVDGSPQGMPHENAEPFTRRTIEGRIQQGDERGVWMEAERAFIVAAMDAWLPALREAPAVAVHRDFGPRNWLVDEAGNLTGVIDWEHSRWDIRAADLSRPWDDAFLSKPYLAAEFEAGYGGFDDALRAEIRAFRFLLAVGGFVWSLQVGDEAYAKLNRAALARLMEAGID